MNFQETNQNEKKIMKIYKFKNFYDEQLSQQITQKT